MGFQSGLSGLNASAKNIDVIGNNVANANTVGFKNSRAVFADVFASSLAGAGASNVGIGVKVAQVQQEFTQGNITVTNNPLDIAINGRGFLRFDNNGTAAYSRNGQLHVDANGYIVNSDSLRLTGYAVDDTNTIVASAPVELRLSTSDISPSPTTRGEVTLNLDSRKPGLATAFSPLDATSYTSSTAMPIYDSLGNAHALTMYFVKTGAGQWNLHATVDGGATTDVDLGAGAGNPATLNFNSSGALTTAMPLANVDITLTNGAVTPLSMGVDFTGSSQYGADFGVTALAQDGYTSGRLTGFSVSDTGIIQGRYSNGQANTLGQIVLANFANNQGLRATGDNLWEETANSGPAVIGTPQTGSLGSIQSAAVEDSNVDLTQELVNMITAQRVYQANAQTIKTQDQVLQTLVNLR
ncbi:MAG: flagellar hook protein FlgE [Burkholderiales bacterium]